MLIVKPGSFGDIIHALPCASALKESFPQAKLTWLVDERWQGLLAGHPAIDRLVIFPRQRLRGLGGKLKSIPWALSLRSLRPDLVIDLQGLLRSALMARASRPGKIIGLSDAREGAGLFYDETARVTATEHSVSRYLKTLEVLGLPPVRNPVFHLPAGSPVAIPSAPFLLLHPFARGAGKSLTQEQIAAFCAAIAPTPVVLAGMGKFESAGLDHVRNLLNSTSLDELIWLIRQAAFVVSVDSGPMHIAAALNPRLLSIHTWSDPRLVGPFSEQAWVWQGGELRAQNLHAPNVLPAREPSTGDLQAIAGFVQEQVRAAA